MTDNVWFWILLVLCGAQAYVTYKFYEFRIGVATNIVGILAFMQQEKNIANERFLKLEEENKHLKLEVEKWKGLATAPET